VTPYRILGFWNQGPPYPNTGSFWKASFRERRGCSSNVLHYVLFLPFKKSRMPSCSQKKYERQGHFRNGTLNNLDRITGLTGYESNLATSCKSRYPVCFSLVFSSQEGFSHKIEIVSGCLPNRLILNADSYYRVGERGGILSQGGASLCPGLACVSPSGFFCFERLNVSVVFLFSACTPGGLHFKTLPNEGSSR